MWIIRAVGCLIIFLLPAATAHAQSSSADSWSTAEQFVLNQLNQREPADLSVAFASIDDRVLSARFLRAILTGGAFNSIPPMITIKHAIIHDALDLSFETIPSAVSCLECEFRAPVSFIGARSKNTVVFSGSRFDDASFDHMQVDGAFLARDTTFVHGATFSYMNIGTSFEVTGAHFLFDNQEADFYAAKIGYAAVFSDAEFRGPVQLIYASTGHNLLFTGARLANSIAANGIKVGGSLFLDHTTVGGAADFISATIDHNIIANDVVFSSAAEGASFNGAKVGGRVSIEQATFAGPADLSYILTHAFQADGAQFKQNTTFESMQVTSNALLYRMRFSADVRFDGASTGGTLDMYRAEFQSTTESATFESIKVGGTFGIEEAKFQGPASFRYASIGSNLMARGAQFTKEDATVVFNNSRVTGNADFQATRFDGSIDFGYMDIGVNLDMSDAQFGSRRQRAIFDNAKVGRTVILDPDSLPVAVSIQDMTYQYIYVGDSRGSWPRLRQLLDHAKWHPSTYSIAESFFRKEGFTREADQVFTAGKDREGHEALAGLERLQNVILGVLVCHGKCAYMGVLWSLLIVMIGAIVFWNASNMRSVEPDKDTPERYNPVWYSIDVFAPVLDLQSGKIWLPRQRWRLWYLRVQKLLGWLLVPLVVAAWTGILK